MSNFRQIIAVGLSVLVVCSSILCYGVRALAADTLTDPTATRVAMSCCASEQVPVRGMPHDCDRCEFGSSGPITEPTAIKLQAPPMTLSAILVPPTVLFFSPFSSVAADSLPPRPPNALSLVALHCQLTI